MRPKPNRITRRGVYRSMRKGLSVRGAGRWVTIGRRSVLSRTVVSDRTYVHDVSGIVHVRGIYAPKGKGGAYLKAWGSRA